MKTLEFDDIHLRIYLEKPIKGYQQFDDAFVSISASDWSKKLSNSGTVVGIQFDYGQASSKDTSFSQTVSSNFRQMKFSMQLIALHCNRLSSTLEDKTRVLPNY